MTIEHIEIAILTQVGEKQLINITQLLYSYIHLASWNRTIAN